MINSQITGGTGDQHRSKATKLAVIEALPIGSAIGNPTVSDTVAIGRAVGVNGARSLRLRQPIIVGGRRGCNAGGTTVFPGGGNLGHHLLGPHLIVHGIEGRS